ncbi:MAG: FAD-linked oxidase C-terminal domain-containing protein [Terrimicrobiaceae bacterium]
MRSASTARELPKALRRKLGAGSVISDEVLLKPYAGDKWFATGVPVVAVHPSTTGEVSAVFKIAQKFEVPVTPRGAGFGYVGGCVPSHGGIVISSERMNRIVEISTPDFVAVVEPGVITGHLQRAVRKKGLFYPPDPASLNDCSIGGNIATNAGGPKCLKYGVTRNYVLGLEVVLADGSVVRCGGRTHKNKTGFDLVGLFVGSEGLLGFVTEATVRLLPFPPSRAVLSAGFVDMAAAARAIGDVFRHGFLPAALEVADRFTLDAARAYRPDAAFPPGSAQLILEVDGQPGSVKTEAKTLADILKNAGATEVQKATTESICEALWNLRRAYSESLKATGLRKLNEDIVVPRGRLVDLVRFAARLQKESGFPIACFGHAGDGNIHVNIMVGDYDQPGIRKRSHAALDKLFAQVLAWGGAITGEHGVGLAKKPWWTAALTQPTRDLHSTLKSAMDPHGILNPGKFVESFCEPGMSPCQIQ